MAEEGQEVDGKMHVALLGRSKSQDYKPVRTEKEALMTIDEGQINWVEQTTDEELNHALMAFTVNNESLQCALNCGKCLYGHGHVNTGKQHVTFGTQFKSGTSRFNTGRQHVNSGSVHVNSGTQIKSGGSRFNTGKKNVNSGRVYVNSARVNRPVSNNTSPNPSQVNLQSQRNVFFKTQSPVTYRPFQGNKDQLEDFEEFNRGSVTFRGCLKRKNALVDQGSDINVMTLYTYMKLTDERPAEIDTRFSLASRSYIYPLGIVEDVLVDVTGYVYLVDFVILDIKEEKKRPFILGTPFLTMAKAVIKFDKGTITLRSRKSKISFHRIPESLCKAEKGIKNDIEPIAPTMTVNRLVLEWEEKIKLHLEK
ncbi:MAK10-like protein [Tanacetum coccineum]